MKNFHTQYITDDKGKKVSVILPIKEYKNIMEELEELEDIRLYDEVKANKEQSIPLEKYIEKRRLKKKKNA
jgi:PHD/YefM family antitoxin component YafN of YafNO toxin-antitoxin module